MKKLIAILLAVLIIVGCGTVAEQGQITLDEPALVEIEEPIDIPKQEEARNTEAGGGGMPYSRHRFGFYQFTYIFSQLVDDRTEYARWVHGRSPEEQMNEAFPIAFVRRFNISREEFERANEEDSQFWYDLGSGRGWTYTAEAMDLIFAFDNEGLSRYFLTSRDEGIAPLAWMFNGEVPVYQSIQMERSNAENFNWHRDRFYTLPDVFVELVGEDEYLEWFNSRSFEERLTRDIASAFVQHFDISREDFEMANEKWRFYHGLEWPMLPEISSWLETYPVDLIFSFDHEAISEFFLWENTPSMLESVFRQSDEVTLLALTFDMLDDTLQLGDDENQDEPSEDDIPGDEPDFDSGFEYEDEVLEDLYLELEDMPELD